MTPYAGPSGLAVTLLVSIVAGVCCFGCSGPPELVAVTEDGVIVHISLEHLRDGQRVVDVSVPQSHLWMGVRSGEYMLHAHGEVADGEVSISVEAQDLYGVVVDEVTLSENAEELGLENGMVGDGEVFHWVAPEQDESNVTFQIQWTVPGGEEPGSSTQPSDLDGEANQEDSPVELELAGFLAEEETFEEELFDSPTIGIFAIDPSSYVPSE